MKTKISKLTPASRSTAGLPGVKRKQPSRS